MSPAHRFRLALAGTLASLILCAWALARPGATLAAGTPPPAAAPGSAPQETLAPDAIHLNLSDRLADLRIEDGAIRLRTDAGEQLVDADTFLRAVDQRQREARSRHWLLQFFDATSFLGLIWVAIGFVGQFVFMGRMIVQWLASERYGRSIVPTAFWWMSLAGGTMVLLYFIWRRDPVGILGQAMGWVIYARNLWLIYRPQDGSPPSPAASPEGPVAAG